VKIPVVRHILSANDAVARENHALLHSLGILTLNLMASPGAGKTSLILATCARLPSSLRPGVIEGDLASSIDADAVAAHGIPVVQINTEGGCHLEATMVRSALSALHLAELGIIFIENVGNLVCPANFALGADRNVVVASTPEGHDKPRKYPGMFAAADAVVLNKADLIDLLDFDLEFFRRGLTAVNSSASLFVLSSRTGAGLENWLAWLLDAYEEEKR
jgi:hydrogenase nickel incorporation protein HypB